MLLVTKCVAVYRVRKDSCKLGNIIFEMLLTRLVGGVVTSVWSVFFSKQRDNLLLNFHSKVMESVQSYGVRRRRGGMEVYDASRSFHKSSASTSTF